MSWHFSRLTNNPSVGPNSLIILHAFKTSAIFSNKLCHPCSCWELNWEVLWTILKQGLGKLSKKEKDQEDPLVEHQLGNWWQSSQTKDDCVVNNKMDPIIDVGKFFKTLQQKTSLFTVLNALIKSVYADEIRIILNSSIKCLQAWMTASPPPEAHPIFFFFFWFLRLGIQSKMSTYINIYAY